MTFKTFIEGIVNIFNTVIIPVIFALAFAVFIWGLLKYFFFGGGNEDKRAEGRQFALWGILALVVLFGVWGLVNILLSTLGIAP